MHTTTAPQTAPAPEGKPRVLCVDDEEHVREGLRDLLRRSFQVRTAESGVDGLELLRAEPDAYAVVVSDMRMPVMSGGAFLNEARRVAPNAVRLVLTGQTELGSAVAAVNDGQVFRFLTKPCARDDLLRACAAAVHQHRLIASEKVLLEETLRGSIKALTDVLALTNPAAFGRASRIKDSAAALARAVGVENAWEVEVAAMLSQIGAVTLPPETAEKLYEGRELGPAEHEMVARMPLVAQRLLANIPRLERVRTIIARHERLFVQATDAPVGARILKIAVDFDALTAKGTDPRLAVETMTGRVGWYDEELLARFAKRFGADATARTVREVMVADLVEGMRFAADVRSNGGSLLVPRGYKVSHELLERLANVGARLVEEPLLVEG
jgi:response regulator RpfG family c-di-GMP phosphodiesterase